MPDQPVSPSGPSLYGAQSDPVPVSPKHRKNRINRGDLAFLKILGALILFIVALVVIPSRVFRLKSVYVSGNTTKTAQQVVALTGLQRGMDMRSITEESIRSHMSSDHTVAFVSMRLEYPSTLYLTVRERQAVAAMQRLGVYYLLDEYGMVMQEYKASAAPAGMPVIKGFQTASVNVGQTLMVSSNKQMEAYRSILYELDQQEYTASVLVINLSDPSNLTLDTVDGLHIRLGDDSYMRAKIGAIRTYAPYLLSTGNTSGVLDVTVPEDGKFMKE